jgi:hypothetical protein
MFFAKPVFCNSFCRINENLYNLSSAKLLELKDRSVDIAAYSDD